jgi:hypothetical protein
MSNTTTPSKGRNTYEPRRPSTSSSASHRPSTSSGVRRPSTSAGEPIEPNSAFLRDALREKKGLPSRARSTTPRRVRLTPRTQSYRDEWLQSDDEERPQPLSVSRPPRARRVSDLGTTKTVTPLSHSLGAREADERMKELKNSNWDLKHRVALYEERIQLLRQKLDEAAVDQDRMRSLREQNEDLKDKVERLQTQLKEIVEETDSIQDNNDELTEINDELVKELESRVKELELTERDATARQAAIEEAAGIIQALELRLAEADRLLKGHSVPSPARTDSDYYSGDAEAARPTSKHLSPAVRPPPTSHSMDSDYFSADTSPLVTPRTHAVKKPGDPSPRDKPLAVQQWNATQQSAVKFNREVGIKYATSKDSLFSSYLESPHLPPPEKAASRLQPLKSLKKRTASVRTLRPATKEDDGGIPPVPPLPQHKVPQGWSDTRPLRSLFMSGDLGLQVKQSETRPIPPPKDSTNRLSRSNTVASPGDNARSQTTMAVSTQPNIHVRSNSVKARPLSEIPDMRGRSNSISSQQRPQSSRSSTTPSRMSQSFSSASSHSAGSNSVPAALIPSLSRHSQVTPTPAPLPPSNAISSPPSASGGARSTTSNAAQQRPLSIAATSSLYSTPPAQTSPTFSSTKQTTRTHRSPLTPNYAIWPRRYPAWPPSAGLANRHLLFHGEGMDEMFGEEDT